MASADAGSTATEIVIRATKIVRIIAIAKLSNHKGIALTNQNRLMLSCCCLQNTGRKSQGAVPSP